MRLTLAACLVVGIMVACTTASPPATIGTAVITESAYRAWLSDILNRSGAVRKPLFTIWDAQVLDSPNWRADVRSRAVEIEQFHAEALRMMPAPGFEGVHAAFLGAMGHQGDAAKSMIDFVTAQESGQPEQRNLAKVQVIVSLAQVERNLDYAIALMNEKNASKK